MFQTHSDALRYIMLNEIPCDKLYSDNIIAQSTSSQAKSSFNTLYDPLVELVMKLEIISVTGINQACEYRELIVPNVTTLKITYQ